MKRKIAVVLSGCGFLDGAEITEAVSTLIALSKHGVEYQCFAPDMNVIAVDHIQQNVGGDRRNVLLEAARICRGNIKELKDLNEVDFDALIFPGGYGVAKNLCTFAEKGAAAEVPAVIKTLIQGFHSSSKPIGAFCIAPALIALCLKDENPNMTIGKDPVTAAELTKLGTNHINCEVTDFVTDRENKIVSTPAYMYEAEAFEVFTGIEKAVAELVEMA